MFPDFFVIEQYIYLGLYNRTSLQKHSIFVPKTLPDPVRMSPSLVGPKSDNSGKDSATN